MEKRIVVSELERVPQVSQYYIINGASRKATRARLTRVSPDGWVLYTDITTFVCRRQWMGREIKV